MPDSKPIGHLQNSIFSNSIDLKLSTRTNDITSFRIIHLSLSSFSGKSSNDQSPAHSICSLNMPLPDDDEHEPTKIMIYYGYGLKSKLVLQIPWKEQVRASSFSIFVPNFVLHR